MGTRWSTKESPEDAVKEAVEMALKGKKDIPDFAVIFASSGSDMEVILSTAKRLFKNKTKIYGGTSDSRAVMTNKGYAKATERAYKCAKMEGEEMKGHPWLLFNQTLYEGPTHLRIETDAWRRFKRNNNLMLLLSFEFRV